LSNRARKVKEVISRNTSFAFGRQFLTGLVFLLVTPYSISKLGIERYGVWALTSALLGYAAVADLGVRTSFKRFVAQRSAMGDEAYILQIVGNGLLFYSVLGSLPVLLALILGRSLLRAFNVTDDLLPEAEPLLLLMTVSFFLVGVGNVFCGVIEGMQKMDVSNGIYVAQSVLLGAGTVAVLNSGKGLVGMGAAAVAATGTGMIAMFVGAQKVTGMGLPPWRLRLSVPVFKELVSYGVRLQGSTAAMLGNLHLDKFLLARFWGLELVAVYDIALRIAFVFRQVPALLVSALVPAVSDLDTRGERALLERLYEKGISYVAAAGLPLAVFALFCADDLLRAWIGQESFLKAGNVLRLLAAAHCTAIVIDAPFATARGLGRLRYELTTGLAHPLAHLSLGLLLVPAFGLWGAGVAQAAVVLGVAVVGARWLHAGLGLSQEPFTHFYRRILRGPALAAIVAACATVPVFALLSGWGPHLLETAAQDYHVLGSYGDRLESAVVLVVSGGLFVAVYGVAALRNGTVSRDDMAGVPVLGRVLSTKLGRLAAGVYTGASVD
jgi:O-antigen/teichoic acid export membrane protein